jgi:DNA gyrase subunit A
MTLATASPKMAGPKISEYIALEANERPVGIVPLPLTAPLAMATSSGVLKRLDVKAVPTRFPADVISLSEGDAVVAAVSAPDDASLVLVSSDAQLLRTPAANVRPQGRSAAGVAGMRLTDATVIAFARALPDDLLVLTTTEGMKLTPIMEYPEKGRGGAGVRCAKLRVAETSLVSATVVAPSDLVVLAEKSVLEPPAHARRDGPTTPLPEAVIEVGIGRPRQG